MLRPPTRRPCRPPDSPAIRSVYVVSLRCTYYNRRFLSISYARGCGLRCLTTLQKRLSSAFRRFRVSGKLTEANMKEGLREVRNALLEADVHFDVVQEFMASVTDKAVGSQLIKSIRPEQQIVKIVHDELIELMGPVDPSIRFEKAGPTVLMLCGLQGSGKTTTCGKLARLLSVRGP